MSCERDAGEDELMTDKIIYQTRRPMKMPGMPVMRDCSVWWLMQERLAKERMMLHFFLGGDDD